MSAMRCPVLSLVMGMSSSSVPDTKIFLGKSTTHFRKSSRFTLRMWGTSSSRTVVSTMPSTPPKHRGNNTVAITLAGPPTP
eukprot:4085758-Pyramimonas_sp.AAC.1